MKYLKTWPCFTALTTIVLFIVLFIPGCAKKDAGEDVVVITPPAGEAYAAIDAGGTSVIPNGRKLTPRGKTMVVAPHPFGLALSPGGTFAVTANSGVSPLSISIVQGPLTAQPRVRQVPPGHATDKGVLASVFMGLAIDPAEQFVYVAGGQENKIYLFGLENGNAAGEIDCRLRNENKPYDHGYIGDMALSRDGKTLFALDQINFSVLFIDTRTRRVTHHVGVGRYPFGIALSPDEKNVYVANVGMFEYKLVKGIDDNNLKDTALKFPASAFNTKRSRDGFKEGGLEVPGLGDPNVPESFSVWIIDRSSPDRPVVSAKIKTGRLVGQLIEGIPAVGGSSPNSLAATSQYVFVSNGNNDTISVIDPVKKAVVRDIHLSLDKRLDQWRGIIPFGLALSPDGKRLYVAESGINAVGVIDVPTMKVLGHIPVGWFPSKLAVTADGKKLVAANAKGFGSGPNGGPAFKPGPEGSYIGHLMKGTLTVMDIPGDEELKKETRRVIDNNFIFTPVSSGSFDFRKDNPVPLYPGQKTGPIKYIVFISKENRTYDEVFGQNNRGRGEPSLARYGKDVTFSDKEKSKTVAHADIMINHLELAKRFAMADNFYVDADVSADGHRWLVNTYPNQWVEATVSAQYGSNRTYRKDSDAPGNLSITGAAGAIYPEDYNEAGSMWDHLYRHKIEYYNFGFGVMFEPASYHESYTDTGMRYFANYPLPTSLYSRTSRGYPTYNMGIPDQFRITRFIEEFKKKWLSGGAALPPVLTVIIPNDHGADERPDAGYPFRESYMADNDLALGRIVEFLSHTPYWKHMAIVITEDDAQGGVDSVDAHRSLLMVVSPYAKKNYTGHVHYSFGSIFKTFWNLLGVPYLNQYDAGAADLADLFTAKPDFSPYNAKPVDPRVFDPQKALTPLHKNFDWKAVEQSPVIDNVKDMIKDSKEQERWRKEKKKKE
jgi:YVTN family beta-propeller protein